MSTTLVASDEFSLVLVPDCCVCSEFAKSWKWGATKWLLDRRTTSARMNKGPECPLPSMGLTSAFVKVFGCRPMTDDAAHSEGRRTKTSKGDAMGRAARGYGIHRR